MIDLIVFLIPDFVAIRSSGTEACMFVCKPTGEEVMRNTTGGNGSPRVPRRSGVVGLYAVPRLEELVADPDKLGVLDPRTRRALTTTALAALNTLIFNELALAAEPSGSISLDRRDRLLDFKQAAEKLGVTPDWLYRNYKDLPFWLRVGRRPRFSENGIEDYIRKRRNT